MLKPNQKNHMINHMLKNITEINLKNAKFNCNACHCLNSTHRAMHSKTKKHLTLCQNYGLDQRVCVFSRNQKEDLIKKQKEFLLNI